MLEVQNFLNGGFYNGMEGFSGFYLENFVWDGKFGPSPRSLYVLNYKAKVTFLFKPVRVISLKLF